MLRLIVLIVAGLLLVHCGKSYLNSYIQTFKTFYNVLRFIDGNPNNCRQIGTRIKCFSAHALLLLLAASGN